MKNFYIKQLPSKQLLRRVLLSLLILISIKTTLKAQFTITENFRGSSVGTDIKIGANAYLTSGIDDLIGAGWLRLTKDLGNQRGYAYIDRSFPSNMGIIIDFEYKAWRTQEDATYKGGDGFSVFLFDAETSQFSIGAWGGSLGYANLYSGSTIQEGLAGAYMGVGFDTYGNFGAASEGKNGGVNNSSDLVPNSVVLRGPKNHAEPYRFLTHKQTNGASDPKIDCEIIRDIRPTDEQFYRRVTIRIIPVIDGGVQKYRFSVSWRTENGGEESELINFVTEDEIPTRLKMGFAASTGGAVDFHEIRNLIVTTPHNMRISKRADKDVLRSINVGGDENKITYTVEVVNDTEYSYTDAQFFDELVNIDGTAIPISMFEIDEVIVGTEFTSANLSIVEGKNIVGGILSIPSNSVGNITIIGRLKGIPKSNLLVNRVSLLPTGGDEDYDLSNNFAELAIPVIAEEVDLTLQTTVDKRCFDPDNGNNFEVKVINMGTKPAEFKRRGLTDAFNRPRIAVTKVIPPGYIYDDSATPDGFGFVLPQQSKWDRIIDNDTPYDGYTTYTYIAKGLSVDYQEVEEYGGEYPYPLRYSIKSITETNYIDETTVQYRGANGNIAYDGEDIEPIENRGNNSSILALSEVPGLPELPNGGIVEYIAGEKANQLTATADSGNSLLWYLSQDGVSQHIAPIPSTKQIGTTTYYVSQANSGGCEGPMAEITVNVLMRNYWVGKVEGETNRHKWSDPTNWTAGYVPAAYKSVEFATEENNGPGGWGNGEGTAKADLHLDNIDQQYSGGGFSGGRIIGDLINMSNKDLVITAGNQLLIDGIVYNKDSEGEPIKPNGGILIKSHPDIATGTLFFTKLEENSGLVATVEFYSLAGRCDDCGYYKREWQYFGIPVERGITFPFKNIPGEEVNYWLTLTSGSRSWQKVTPTTEMAPLRCYQITSDVAPDEPYLFTGKLRLSRYTFYTLNTEGLGPYSKIFIVSNPFTGAIPISPISIRDQLNNLLEHTVYLFNQGTRDQWRKLNGSSITGIAAGQYLAVPLELGGEGRLPDRIPSMHTFLIILDGNQSNLRLDYTHLIKNTVSEDLHMPAWRSATSSTKSGSSTTPPSSGGLRSDTASSDSNTDSATTTPSASSASTSSLKNQTGSASTEKGKRPYIIADAIGERSADRIWIFAVKGTTRGFDNGWDARKMAEEGLTQLYTLDDTGEERFQVASVPTLDGISIGFEPDSDGSYELQFALSAHWTTEEIYLHDLKTGEQQRVVDGGSYRFEASKKDSSERFRLSYSGSGIFAQEIEESDIQILTLGDGKIFIKNESNNQCSIFISESESGKLLTYIEVETGSETVIENMPEGRYLIRIENDHINDVRRLTLK